MLQQAMRALGFDLDREVARLIARAKDQFEALNARTIRELKSYTRQLAELAILLAAGAAFCVVAAGIALTALFLFLDERYGTYRALGTIGGIAVVVAAILLYAAWSRANPTRDEPAEPIAPSVPPIMTEEAIAAAAPRPRAALDLATLLPPPPAGAGLTEVLLHRAKTRGAEAAEEAIDQAETIVRTGSRGAIVATLAATVLVGVFFGRQQRS